jgi:hypothetical protein
MLVSRVKFDLLGGIAAVRALLRLDHRLHGPDLNFNLFGRYMFNVFPPFGLDIEAMQAGAQAIGALATHGLGALTQQFVSKVSCKRVVFCPCFLVGFLCGFSSFGGTFQFIRYLAVCGQRHGVAGARNRAR